MQQVRMSFSWFMSILKMVHSKIIYTILKARVYPHLGLDF
jgi:hypothetical protein